MTYSQCFLKNSSSSFHLRSIKLLFMCTEPNFIYTLANTSLFDPCGSFEVEYAEAQVYKTNFFNILIVILFVVLMVVMLHFMVCMPICMLFMAAVY